MSAANRYNKKEGEYIDALFKKVADALETQNSEALRMVNEGVKLEQKEVTGLNSKHHARHNMLITLAAELVSPSSVEDLWGTRDGAVKAAIVAAKFGKTLSPVVGLELDNLVELRAAKFNEHQVLTAAKVAGGSLIMVDDKRVCSAARDDDAKYWIRTESHSGSVAEVSGIVKNFANEASRMDSEAEVVLRFDVRAPEELKSITLPWDKSPSQGLS